MNSKNTCLCVDKLNQLHNTIHTELVDCKDKVWNFKIASLTKERDSLLLRNEDLRSKLTDLQSKIASDPFMARRYQELCNIKPSENLENTDISQVYKQLYTYQDLNNELKDRLSLEQMNSMSWKHKFYDLENKISSQISELLQLTQSGNCVESTDYAKFKTEHYSKVAKEALELLKQAKNRIEGDRYSNFLHSFVT
uniref:Uncharacterized protein n=1 Tax=Theileria annulata TaxID=5874 RepID=A0A3B0NB40_THEAN